MSTVTKRVTTIALTGEVKEVRFDREYPYFEVANMDSAPVYLSKYEDVSAGTDGVYTIPSGQGKVARLDTDIIYVSGSGTVQVTAKYEANPSYKGTASGGGGTIANANVIRFALDDAGYNVSSDPETWGQTVIDKFMEYDYKIDSAGTVITYSSRKVNKTTDDTAYFAWYTTTNNWFTPLFLGATAQSVSYTMDGAQCTSPSTFVADGKIVYYNLARPNSMQNATVVTSDKNRRCLGYKLTDTTADNKETIARKLYEELSVIGYVI